MILSNVQALAPRPAAASARDDIDRELIAKIGNLDKDAFRSLCIHYHRILARFLSKFTRDRADIEEIVNDTLWIVWKNAGAFRSESRVSRLGVGIRPACERTRY